MLDTLHKKWRFPVQISSAHVTKSAVLVTFTEETLNEKLQFLCSNKASIQGLIKFRLVLMMVLYRRSLYEKYPNSEFFLARMFPYSDLIWRFIFKIFILIQNTGKYGPKKTPYLDNFHAVVTFT